MSDGFLILAIGFAVLAYGLQQVLIHVRMWNHLVEQITACTQHAAIAISALCWFLCFGEMAWRQFQ